jgi:hypothetical protein
VFPSHDDVSNGVRDGCRLGGPDPTAVMDCPRDGGSRGRAANVAVRQTAQCASLTHLRVPKLPYSRQFGRFG